MSGADDFNSQIMAEFRANGGRVGGPLEGAPLLLLHSIGAKSGLERVNPVMYQALDEGWAVFASKAGASTSPDWYHNLVANSEASIEVGTDTVAVSARVAEAEEREQIWTRQKNDFPTFAEYERGTTRTIPVVVLEPRP